MGHSWDTDVYIIVTNFLTGSCFSFTCGAGHTAKPVCMCRFLTHFFQRSLFFSADLSLHSNVFVSFFVLCHPAAPDESENVVQSDESENGILFKSADLKRSLPNHFLF